MHIRVCSKYEKGVSSYGYLTSIVSLPSNKYCIRQKMTLLERCLLSDVGVCGRVFRSLSITMSESQPADDAERVSHIACSLIYDGYLSFGRSASNDLQSLQGYRNLRHSLPLPPLRLPPPLLLLNQFLNHLQDVRMSSLCPRRRSAKSPRCRSISMWTSGKTAC